MDEKDIIERLGPPDKIVRLMDRVLSREWRCSRCGHTVEDTVPIPVPAPCPKCNGIAFEAVEPVLQ
jgi:rubrerythrin